MFLGAGPLGTVAISAWVAIRTAAGSPGRAAVEFRVVVESGATCALGAARGAVGRAALVGGGRGGFGGAGMAGPA